MKTDNYFKGSITIFLALSLTLILSIVFSTVESSRRFAITSYIEGITRISFDSVFSSYCTQLWDDYHVFAVITNNSEFIGLLKSNINKNSNNTFLSAYIDDITINEFTNLSDNYGEYFIEQILSYMQYKEISYVADYLLAESNIDYDPTDLLELADGELEAADFEALDFGSLLDMVSSSNDSFLDEDFELNLSLSDSFTLDSLKNITHIFEKTLLYYVVENSTQISFNKIKKDGLPTNYIELPEKNKMTQYGLFDRFLFCEYLINNFSSYTTKVQDGPLDYQIEYLIQGYDSDDDNLLKIVQKLILLRFGFNVTHIITNKVKMNTLSALANTVSIIPVLPIIIQIILISLWALSESIIDVRDLLAGKKVPLFKTSDDWTLSIENISNFDYYTESSNDNDNGLSYNNYLEILLVNNNIHQLALRSLDLIQLDISTNINDTFLISNCFIGASCTFNYTSNNLFAPNGWAGKPAYTITQNYYYR